MLLFERLWTQKCRVLLFVVVCSIKPKVCISTFILKTRRDRETNLITCSLRKVHANNPDIHEAAWFYISHQNLLIVNILCITINKSERLVLCSIVETLICHGPIYILSDAPFQHLQTSVNRFNTNMSLYLQPVHPFFRNKLWALDSLYLNTKLLASPFCLLH